MIGEKVGHKVQLIFPKPNYESLYLHSQILGINVATLIRSIVSDWCFENRKRLNEYVQEQQSKNSFGKPKTQQ